MTNLFALLLVNPSIHRNQEAVDILTPELGASLTGVTLDRIVFKITVDGDQAAVHSTYWDELVVKGRPNKIWVSVELTESDYWICWSYFSNWIPC